MSGDNVNDDAETHQTAETGPLIRPVPSKDHGSGGSCQDGLSGRERGSQAVGTLDFDPPDLGGRPLGPGVVVTIAVLVMVCLPLELALVWWLLHLTVGVPMTGTAQ